MGIHVGCSKANQDRCCKAGGETGLCFNISHTHGLVACIIARNARVGIDVEVADRAADSLLLAEEHFAPCEVEALRKCERASREARFVELWVLKEAYLKGIGAGLSVRLNELAFRFDERSCSLRFEANPTASVGEWQFALFAPSTRHRMAVAAELAVSPRVAIQHSGDTEEPESPAQLATLRFSGEVATVDGSKERLSETHESWRLSEQLRVQRAALRMDRGAYNS